MRIGKSDWVLLGQGWVIYLVNGCAFKCRSICGQVWVYICKSRQVLMGQTDQMGIGDISSWWLCVCVQM